MKFKHELGAEVEARVSLLRGIITSRSENLYGCNRYYVQPRAVDNKLPDGWWTDEDDLVVIGEGVKQEPKPTGGPMSKVC